MPAAADTRQNSRISTPLAFRVAPVHPEGDRGDHDDVERLEDRDRESAPPMPARITHSRVGVDSIRAATPYCRVWINALLPASEIRNSCWEAPRSKGPRAWRSWTSSSPPHRVLTLNVERPVPKARPDHDLPPKIDPAARVVTV
jgi:hypothetical protein